MWRPPDLSSASVRPWLGFWEMQRCCYDVDAATGAAASPAKCVAAAAPECVAAIPQSAYDGIGLMVRLTKAIRARITTPGFLLSHAPQTPYLTLKDTSNLATPGFWGSYLSVLAQVGPLGTPGGIDFFNVQAYNQNGGAQGCPASAVIVNNLLQATPAISPLPPVFGAGLVVPQSPPSGIAYGQLIPPNPPTTPWCGGGPGGMNPDVGLMFWLQNPGDSVVADAVVDAWLPRQGSALTPTRRVVYYMNNPGSVLEDPVTKYSRASVVIVGFAFPLMNTYGPCSCADEDVSRIVTSVPTWATFALCYGGWGGGMAALAAWRATDPAHRKIMIGIGGAQATPMYDTWSQDANVDVVAQGLFEFLEAFRARHGFALDGIDIDYEDSANLDPSHKGMQPSRWIPSPGTAPVPRPVPTIPGPGGVPGTSSGGAPGPSPSDLVPEQPDMTTTSTQPLLIAACVLVILVFLMVIAGCVMYGLAAAVSAKTASRPLPTPPSST